MSWRKGWLSFLPFSFKNEFSARPHGIRIVRILLMCDFLYPPAFFHEFGFHIFWGVETFHQRPVSSWGTLFGTTNRVRLFSGSGHFSDLVIDNDLHRQTRIDALHPITGHLPSSRINRLVKRSYNKTIGTGIIIVVIQTRSEDQ